MNTMRIEMRDGRVFEGMPAEIVAAMQRLAFGYDGRTRAGYIEWVVGNARRYDAVELQVTGDTDDERAASLVDEMVRVGLAVAV